MKKGLIKLPINRSLKMLLPLIFLVAGCKEEIKKSDMQKTLVIIENTDIPKNVREEILIGTVMRPYSYGCIDAFLKSKKNIRDNGKKITRIDFAIPKICLQTVSFDSARTLLFKNDSVAEIDIYYTYIQTKSTSIKDTIIIKSVSIQHI